MGKRLTDFQKARVREWLVAMRDGMPMQTLVEDINRTRPAWRIDRTRYGRYESGEAPLGPKPYAELLAYWTSKGRKGPDFTPAPPAAPEPTLPGALMALAVELRELRSERKALVARVAQLEDWVDQLIEQIPGAPSRQALTELPAQNATGG